MGQFRTASLLLALSVFGYGAEVCAKTDILGAYGFQLTGTTTISGVPTPIASIGRVVLDNDGKISGYSSVNFNGFFLGNPITGTYEINTDCNITWSLQDDSGAWQHFAGKVMQGGARVDFHQADPGTGGRGVMKKTHDGWHARA